MASITYKTIATAECANPKCTKAIGGGPLTVELEVDARTYATETPRAQVCIQLERAGWEEQPQNERPWPLFCPACAWEADKERQHMANWEKNKHLFETADADGDPAECS